MEKLRAAAPASRRVQAPGTLLVAASLALQGAACAGARSLPPPRPIIVHSGVRVVPDAQRLEQIDEWLRRELETIEKDPTFLLRVTPRDTAPLPWDGIEFRGDTAEIMAPRDVMEAGQVLMIYAHLRLMERMGRLAEWLPEAAEAPAYERERAVVKRLCDAWLYARTIADAPPYAPLDELLYACEFGYLDAYLLTARAGEFREQRERWMGEQPSALEEYRRWFRATFGKEPPGAEGEEL